MHNSVILITYLYAHANQVSKDGPPSHFIYYHQSYFKYQRELAYPNFFNKLVTQLIKKAFAIKYTNFYFFQKKHHFFDVSKNF